VGKSREREMLRRAGTSLDLVLATLTTDRVLYDSSR
jgi:hypothetical protein